MKEGDQIVTGLQAGDPKVVAFVALRQADGATIEDIRQWYNTSPRKRTRLVDSATVARATIYAIATKKWGDQRRAIDYAKARVPTFSDTSVNEPPPDASDPHRPLVCALQPRVDRWLSTMRLRPCADDELDQKLVGFGTVNSLIRSEIRAGRL
jgi:hypothetical protein